MKKIIIQTCLDRLGSNLFFIDGDFALVGDTWIDMRKNEAVKPTLYLPPGFESELLKALQEHGVKSPEESKVKGLYEAQSAHLKDLRTLLKLK